MVIDGAVVTIALPTIAAALRISQAQSVMVITIYQLLLAIILIPMSSLAERLGTRRLFRTGLAIFIAGTSLCLLAGSLWHLLALRALQAVGAGMVLSVGSAQIRSVYPLRILGRGLALNSLIVAIFTALSPVIGAVILANAPWPFVFSAAAPLAAIALLASPALPESEPKAARFDVLSAGLYALAVGMLFTAADGTVIGDMPMVRLLALFGAGGFGWLCLRRARTAPRPLLPVDLLANRTNALSVCGSVCTFASSMAVLILLPFRLGELHGMAIGQLAIALSIWPISVMIVAPLVGLLSDRLPPWALGSAGLLSASFALLALMNAPPEASVIDLGWRLALCGAGYATYSASNYRLILASAPRDRAAPVGALISTSRIIGQSAGAILAATVLAGKLGATPEGLAVPLALALVGIMISIARRKHQIA